MCVPDCVVALSESASRRDFLRQAGASFCATAAAPSCTKADKPARHSFQSVVDLTHTLSASFPMTWPEPFRLEQVSKLGKDRWNAYRWHLQEHSGTHIDAPLHCTQGPSADRIPIDDLVGPLVVVDIRSRTAKQSDAALSPDDLRAWEQRHGPIAAGSVVALFSGWDTRVDDSRRFFGLDEQGGYHFPGFHLEAVQFLHEQRQVKGIATDTASLDPGSSAEFPAHLYWLGRNKWGLENVAGLGQLPPNGSTIIVGAPKIAGCTGGPSRVMALV